MTRTLRFLYQNLTEMHLGFRQDRRRGALRRRGRAAGLAASNRRAASRQAGVVEDDRCSRGSALRMVAAGMIEAHCSLRVDT
jgi:hypothetical protein